MSSEEDQRSTVAEASIAETEPRPNAGAEEGAASGADGAGSIEAGGEASAAPASEAGADASAQAPEVPSQDAVDTEISDEAAAEIDAAMESASGLGAGAYQPQKAKLRGPRKVEGGREHRTGYVVSVGPTDIFVEFGPKELGVLERSQFKDKETGEERGLPVAGEKLEVVVQRFEPSENIFICALPGAVQKADWEMLQPGQVVEAKVTGTNKGGLDLDVAGHRAFMPAGQVDVQHHKDLSVFVGEKLTCRVQRIDRRGKGNIVLSRRELLEEERARTAEKLRESLKEGDVVEGTVRKIMDFGAFVDLGGVDGLIHIADLSHDRVNHGAKNVARHVSEGQNVRVQILKLDWENNRISLGLKQLQSDPFDAAASEVVEGAELTGKVTKLMDFGAFVEVAPGVEGLVHISELDHRRVAKVEEAVQAGEVVQVKVLKVDPETRRVSLSIKALKEPPAPAKGGGGGGRGRGKGRDDRSADEIMKETPQLRRLREQAKKEKAGGKSGKGRSGKGGLGDSGAFGPGLGDIKL